MMKRYGLLLLVGVLLMVTAETYANGPVPPSRSLGLAASGSTLKLRPGEKIEVRLDAQLGTGYSWTPTSYDQSVLKLVSEGVAGLADRKLGATETQLFIFEAAKPGHTNLLMRYERPWVPAEKGETFHLDVYVTAG